MGEKIRIIIADDNKGFCYLLSKFLEKFEDIEILGIANTDEDEIKLMETVKPDIVISDLARNHKYTGLDIIKQYNKKKEKPKFLVITADKREDFINDDVQFDGFIQKPCPFDVIISELRKLAK